MAGRILIWPLELSEFDIKYEDKKSLKAQALADFVAEMTPSRGPTNLARRWTIFIDGTSSSSENGVGILLENREGIIFGVSLTLSFLTSNNQVE